MTDEQKAAAEQLGRKGLVYVPEQKRLVASHGLVKPRQVFDKVAASVPFDLHMGVFISIWTNMEIRPAGDCQNPERTDERYCIYDSLDGNYGYTDAFVNKVIRDLQTEEGYRKLVGRSSYRDPSRV